VLSRAAARNRALRLNWRGREITELGPVCKPLVENCRKQYEKWRRFLCTEATSNARKDFGLGRSLQKWEALRRRRRGVVDRFAASQTRAFNVYGEFDLLARLAGPVTVGQTNMGGFKVEQARVMRLMEVLLQAAGEACGGWTARQLHERVLGRFQLKPTLMPDCRRNRAYHKVDAAMDELIHCLAA